MVSKPQILIRVAVTVAALLIGVLILILLNR